MDVLNFPRINTNTTETAYCFQPLFCHFGRSFLRILFAFGHSLREIKWTALSPGRPDSFRSRQQRSDWQEEGEREKEKKKMQHASRLLLGKSSFKMIIIFIQLFHCSWETVISLPTALCCISMHRAAYVAVYIRRKRDGCCRHSTREKPFDHRTVGPSVVGIFFLCF